MWMPMVVILSESFKKGFLQKAQNPETIDLWFKAVFQALNQNFPDRDSSP